MRCLAGPTDLPQIGSNPTSSLPRPVVAPKLARGTIARRTFPPRSRLMTTASFRLRFCLWVALAAGLPARAGESQRFDQPLDVQVPHISSDPSVRYDYDIVYVR